MHNTQMYTAAQLERLAKLSEELGEVQQVIGKILRFGYASRHPDTQESNKMRLEEELGHIFAVVDLLTKTGDLDDAAFAIAGLLHKEKMKKHMRFQDDKQKQTYPHAESFIAQADRSKEQAQASHIDESNLSPISEVGH